MNTEEKKLTLEQVEALEHAPGADHENLEGWIPRLDNEHDLRQALDKAVDYRGDVTLTLKDGQRIEAFIFNSQSGPTLEESFLQYFTPDTPEKRKVGYADIASVEFTGKDHAAGKHWEDWVKKYNERKAAGETNIALKPEELE